MATEAQLAEKALQDRRGVRTPSPALEPPRRGNGPPPLPPRENSVLGPPAYSAEDAKRSEMISEAWRSNDPRSSSTHSLVPSDSGRGRDGRRKLLLVFIHGFMGNETSFQSFPAHLHNLLTIALAETHIVHTKIYPRYKSRRAIDFARDDFGNWLEPHEDAATDVILLGHSMGGILSAEVALQPPPSPSTGQPFAHRILGTISFDTPYLGMHPGVIASGIGSLFRPAPEPPGSKPTQATSSGANSPSLEGRSSASIYSQGASTSASHVGESDASSQLSRLTSPLATPPPDDPYFNPPFPNDVRIPERKGLNNLLHFVNKHAEGLTAGTKFSSLSSATKSYFMSHLEFGGCMADYPGLKARYTKLRALEDVDDVSHRGDLGNRPGTRRIRFVNYYTASTGRPKETKIPHGHMVDKDGQLKPIDMEMRDMSLENAGNHTPKSTPSVSVEQYGDGTVTPQELENALINAPIETQMMDLGENSGVHDEVQEPAPMRHIESMPIEEDEDEPDQVISSIETTEEQQEAPGLAPASTDPPLPPIPAMPTEPQPIDLSLYTDKDSRKIAEKEHKRITKAYQQAMKDRESAIKDRKKLVEKREKKARQETEKQLKAEQKQRVKEQKEEEKRIATVNPAPAPLPVPAQPASDRARSPSAQDDKPKRDKKFCMLPPELNGKRDKCWIRVYMEGVDEVGAHCGLFFPGPQYESLVGNVGERIEEWIKEDVRRRGN